MRADRIVSTELARHLAAVSREIGRQVGVLINRRGHIEKAFVGDAKRIYLPEVGRQRAGGGHFRGLRHVHTEFDGGGINRDDLADLTKLRLDLVCALHVRDDGEPGVVHYAYHRPGSGEGAHHLEFANSIHEVTLNFAELITALEEELSRYATVRTASKIPAAVVVGVYDNRDVAAWRLVELRELATTAGVRVAETVVQIRHNVHSKYVVGCGKLEEAVLLALDRDAGLIIFDHNLTPAQARAIAAFSDLKVIDRTQLILDIFAQHAKSRDGRLQVELAQLKYNLPRLTDMDAGLSRLTGGIGGRGPGETKLEINRRRARDRIGRLEREIDNLSKQRSLRRNKRQRTKIPTISIVGYTNAGKSTLLNRLTHSDVLVADQLFATLDTTSRRLRCFGREAIITDTVGFIRDLPPDLVKAFRATLEELEEADLLLHVVDIADPMRDEKVRAVNELLDELHLGGIPRVLAYNKSDKIPAFESRALAIRDHATPLSAHSGMGCATLLDVVCEHLGFVRESVDDGSWAATGTDATSDMTAPDVTAPDVTAPAP